MEERTKPPTSLLPTPSPCPHPCRKKEQKTWIVELYCASVRWVRECYFGGHTPVPSHSHSVRPTPTQSGIHSIPHSCVCFTTGPVLPCAIFRVASHKYTITSMLCICACPVCFSLLSKQYFALCLTTSGVLPQPLCNCFSRWLSGQVPDIKSVSGWTQSILHSFNHNEHCCLTTLSYSLIHLSAGCLSGT